MNGPKNIIVAIAAIMRRKHEERQGRKLQISVHPAVLERLRKEDEGR